MLLSWLFSCLPLLTTETFRSYADHVLESLNPSQVREGEMIFIKTADLSIFFSSFHHKIQAGYFLLTHVSDESTPGPYAHFLEDPKLLGWYAINWDGTVHEKLYPIPLGLGFSTQTRNLSAVTEIHNMNLPKKHLLFMNFTIQTFSKERWEVFKQFSFEPYCFRTGKKEFRDYLIDLASSYFVLAPRGAGMDTYRLWEAVYMGCIPIVKTSSLDPLYEDLPVLIVKDWREISEGFLQEKYEEFSRKNFSFEKLDVLYWILNKK